MATIMDVAAYILGKRGPMTAMKLQKLCYFAYAYHLAWEDRRLFPQRFEAWANGPVSPALYACHRGRFQLAEGDIDGDPTALNATERESVDLVLEGLGELTAHQLSAQTHAEGPWVSARERARVAPMQRSTEELTDVEIMEFFQAVTAADANGQER
ncbi:type II toxin-antitoxin system antitoxin SocA domain-containing protein [Actinomadura bangladeshensis]|uniref:DUF4065 domain-containing protein n=1 Tax=Actinomadura bangladeshensis TaxID=453573 RepID=A0A6L9QHK0_9ACTN|nr:DUF4065 domain-containing protein [Actinomadura bangladeshensis]